MLRELIAYAPPDLLLLLACRDDGVSCPSPESELALGHARSPGSQLVAELAEVSEQTEVCLEGSPSSAVSTVQLAPVDSAGCAALAAAELGVDELPPAVAQLVSARSGGSPLLCQAIARKLVRRGAVALPGPDSPPGERRHCLLTEISSARQLNAAATEAVVEERHCTLSAKMGELSLLQRLVLKAMAMLPQQCSQRLLLHVMPVPVDAAVLAAELCALRAQGELTTAHSALTA